MKRFFKSKNAQADPTPYPLDPSGGNISGGSSNASIPPATQAGPGGDYYNQQQTQQGQGGAYQPAQPNNMLVNPLNPAQPPYPPPHPHSQSQSLPSAQAKQQKLFALPGMGIGGGGGGKEKDKVTPYVFAPPANAEYTPQYSQQPQQRQYASEPFPSATRAPSRPEKMSMDISREHELKDREQGRSKEKNYFPTSVSMGFGGNDHAGNNEGAKIGRRVSLKGSGEGRGLFGLGGGKKDRKERGEAERDKRRPSEGAYRETGRDSPSGLARITQGQVPLQPPPPISQPHHYSGTPSPANSETHLASSNHSHQSHSQPHSQSQSPSYNSHHTSSHAQPQAPYLDRTSREHSRDRLTRTETPPNIYVPPAPGFVRVSSDHSSRHAVYETGPHTPPFAGTGDDMPSNPFGRQSSDDRRASLGPPPQNGAMPVGRERGASSASAGGGFGFGTSPGARPVSPSPLANASAFLQPRNANKDLPERPAGTPPVPSSRVLQESLSGSAPPTAGLAAPEQPPPRRSGEYGRSSHSAEDHAHEGGRGGLRAMLGMKDYKEDFEAEDAKKKKGFFGLGGKDKDDGKGRKLRKSREAQEEQEGYQGPGYDGRGAGGMEPPIQSEWVSVPEPGSYHSTPGHSASSPPTGGRAISPMPLMTGVVAAPGVYEVSKKDREKGIREAQERTKEQLKQEKKGREREEKERNKVEKEFAQMEKDEQKRKGERGSATWTINDLCERAIAQEYPLILEISERISHSNEEVAKEAAKAIRKVIKYGVSEYQFTEPEKVMGMKIWLLGCTNSPPKGAFRAQLTSKRFLQMVEGLLVAERDKPSLSQDAYDRLRDTLAHLTFHYGREKGSEALRETWVKVKTTDEPADGYPLAELNPVYSMTDRLLRQHEGRPVPDQLAVVSPNSGSLPTSVMAGIPNERDDLNRLLRECFTCKEHARVLHSALVHARLETFEADPIIQEFYRTCVRDQESLVSQMGWASAQAERSKEERGLITPTPNAPAFEQQMEGLQIQHTEDADGTPLGEQVFTELLAASQELTEVLKLHEDMEGDARDEKELRLVQERSKNDTRMNRASWQYDANGSLAPPSEDRAGSSRSRSPSPSRLQAEFESRNNRNANAGMEAPRRPFADGVRSVSRSSTPESVEMVVPQFPQDSRTGSPTRLAAKIQGPRPLGDGMRRNQHGSSNSLRSLPAHGSSAHSHSGRSPLVLANEFDNDDSDEGPRHGQPSSKALGKRKAVEKEKSDFDPDDIWKTGDTVQESSDSSSDEDVVAYWERRQPTIYVYDAAKERQEERKREVEVARAAPPPGQGGSGSGSGG